MCDLLWGKIMRKTNRIDVINALCEARSKMVIASIRLEEIGKKETAKAMDFSAESLQELIEQIRKEILK